MPAPAPAPVCVRAARWLALGDSYTIGEGVAPGGRWPEQVAAMLSGAATTVEIAALVATTGWTCEDLLAGMTTAGVWPALERHALVSLLIGVNDQYRGRAPRDFAAAFAACLARAIALAGGEPARVLVLSIPDWGVTPFATGRDRAAIARAIDECNAHEHALAAAHGTHWCDITARSRQHGDDRDHLAADGLHPSALAYADWARTIVPVALDALRGVAPRQP